MLLRTLGFVLCIALGLSASVAFAERIDGVAARVGRQIITLSEVEIEARIVLVRRGGERGLSAEIDQRLRRKVLDFMVVQTLLEREARRRGGTTVSESDVDKGIVLLKSRFQSRLEMGADEAYARFLKIAFVDDEDIRSVVRRDLRVQDLLRQVLPDVNALLQKDVEKYFVQHPELLGTDDERRAQTKNILLKQMQEKAFAAFVDELRQRVEVRIVERFAATVGLPDDVEKQPSSPADPSLLPTQQ
ncbi:MAG: hypothetical protein GY822_18840 [Deltaproteobacteria bacterium]|nr:hypothetical protein [Deltaproteobacteria bacterium]